MDKAKFYSELRKRDSGVFGTSISQAQVDSIEAILHVADQCRVDNADLGYILGTAYHECKMVPVRESLYYTSAARIAEVWPSRFSVASAGAFVRNSKKLANEVYNGRMGNAMFSGDGYNYRGAGLVQITGRDNFRKYSEVTGVDILSNPDLANEPAVAAEIIVRGMVDGGFTGYRLDEFRDDYVGARKIVNPDSNGELVAGYAHTFYMALVNSGRSVDVVAPEPVSVEKVGFWDRILRFCK